jgi:hypothetical protein
MLSLVRSVRIYVPRPASACCCVCSIWGWARAGAGRATDGRLVGRRHSAAAIEKMDARESTPTDPVTQIKPSQHLPLVLFVVCGSEYRRKRPPRSWTAGRRPHDDAATLSWPVGREGHGGGGVGGVCESAVEPTSSRSHIHEVLSSSPSSVVSVAVVGGYRTQPASTDSPIMMPLNAMLPKHPGGPSSKLLDRSIGAPKNRPNHIRALSFAIRLSQGRLPGRLPQQCPMPRIFFSSDAMRSAACLARCPVGYTQTHGRRGWCVCVGVVKRILLDR